MVVIYNKVNYISFHGEVLIKKISLNYPFIFNNIKYKDKWVKETIETF